MDDLISRQAVLNATSVTLRITGKENAETVYWYIKKLCDDIKALPSAQSERKTGRWLPDNTDYYRTKFICSVCGESEEVPTTGFGYGTMWNYCPLCGAKMEDERKE